MSIRPPHDGTEPEGRDIIGLQARLFAEVYGPEHASLFDDESDDFDDDAQEALTDLCGDVIDTARTTSSSCSTSTPSPASTCATSAGRGGGSSGRSCAATSTRGTGRHAVTAMTSTERNQLVKLAQQRERLAKIGITEGEAARLLAEFEELAATYSLDDPAWKDAVRTAKGSRKGGQRRDREGVGADGQPRRVRPICLCAVVESRRERGQGASRGVAQGRADTAKRWNAKPGWRSKPSRCASRTLSGGFDSDAAREFLVALPTPTSCATFPVAGSRSNDHHHRDHARTRRRARRPPPQPQTTRKDHP